MINLNIEGYTIVREISRGGMARVFEATQNSLGRQVALKVMSPELYQDEAFRERFIREARTQANLNHPNILKIHEVRDEKDLLFIAMEYVSGGDLKQKIDDGLAAKQALNIAIDVAGALECAHSNGLIHRDIKPQNVLFTNEGKAVLTDFGISKSLQQDAQSLTKTGLSLGTPAYMAPEQFLNNPIDHRVDIYALGVMLYQMLTGEQPFSGNSTAALSHKHVNNPVPILAGGMARFQPLVERLSAKEPGDRPSSAIEAANLIRRYLEDDIDEPTLVEPGRTISPDRIPASHRQRALIAFSGISIAIIALLLWALINVGVEKPGQTITFRIQPPEGVSVSRTVAHAFDIASDGSYVVFNGTKNGDEQLYRRNLDEVDAYAIAGTEGAGSVWLSPNGDEYLSMYPTERRGKSLKLGKLQGGAPSELVELENSTFDIAWSSSGMLVYSDPIRQVLMSLSEDMVSPSPLTALDDTPESYHHELPAFVDSTKSLLFVKFEKKSDDGFQHSIYHNDIDSGREKLVLAGATAPQLFGNFLLFFRAGDIWAARYSSVSNEIVGEAQKVLPGVQFSSTGEGDVLSLAVSDNGTVVYEPSVRSSQDNHRLYWLDKDGNHQYLDGLPMFQIVDLNANHRSLLFGNFEDYEMYLYSQDRGTVLELGKGSYPRFSASGERVFYSGFGDDNKLYSVSLTGEDKKVLFEPNDDQVLEPYSVSQDGQWLVVNVRSGGQTRWDVGVLNLLNSDFHIPISSNKDDGIGVLSPDSKWLIYHARESGESDALLRPFPNTNAGLWKINSEAHDIESFYWSQDGNKIYYNTQQGDLVEVRFDPDRSEPLSDAKVLTNLASGDPDLYSRLWGTNAENDSFLICEHLPQSHERELIVITNWHSVLDAKLP